MELDASDQTRAESYRAHAALMRAMAAKASDERLSTECLALAAKWELLATRLVPLGTSLTNTDEPRHGGI